MPVRKPHDPLKGISWREGTAPSAEPPAAQQRQEQEPDYSIFNADHMLMIRAVRTIRDRYGVKSLTAWTDFHDKKAKQLLQSWLNPQPKPQPEPPKPRLREGSNGQGIPWSARLGM